MEHKKTRRSLLKAGVAGAAAMALARSESRSAGAYQAVKLAIACE